MNDILLAEGAKRFGIEVSDLELIGGFTDNVFEYKRGNFILKFYDSSHYEKSSLESELDWILYLDKAGVNVTTPTPSLRGTLLETVKLSNLDECWIVAFKKADGRFASVSDKGEWNAEFFNTWGKTLGEIHSLSKQYKPITNRNDWNSGLIQIMLIQQYSLNGICI